MNGNRCSVRQQSQSTRTMPDSNGGHSSRGRRLISPSNNSSDSENIKKKPIRKNVQEGKKSKLHKKRKPGKYPFLKKMISSWCPKAQRAWVEAMGCSTMLKQITHGGDCSKQKATKITGWLKLDKRFAQMNAILQKSTTVIDPNLSECQRALNELICMIIDPVMLKKHPDIVATVNKLKRYVGSCEAWKLPLNKEIEFKVEAELIRRKASRVYEKFLSLFPRESYANRSFQGMFMEEVKKFNKASENLTDHQKDILDVDPVIFKPKFRDEASSRNTNSGEDDTNMEDNSVNTIEIEP